MIVRASNKAYRKDNRRSGYSRLAGISVAQRYNLRQQTDYQRQRRAWTKTRPVTIATGQRRAPTPNNEPGYLRVDSVCQGDLDDAGLYHLNAVDCVTQYEGVATCERISEAFAPGARSAAAELPLRHPGFPQR